MEGKRGKIGDKLSDHHCLLHVDLRLKTFHRIHALLTLLSCLTFSLVIEYYNGMHAIIAIYRAELFPSLSVNRFIVFTSIWTGYCSCECIILRSVCELFEIFQNIDGIKIIIIWLINACICLCNVNNTSNRLGKCVWVKWYDTEKRVNTKREYHN